MDLEIRNEGEESSELALRFFRDHLSTVFKQVKASFGIDYDIEATLRHDEGELPLFSPPSGRMLVARVGGLPVGIACLKTIGPRMGEVKHVYVDPNSRGLGVGRRLMEALIRESRAMGHSILRLDSGRFQTAAHKLYRSLGFVEIPRYPENQVPESDAHIVLFMELRF